MTADEVIGFARKYGIELEPWQRAFIRSRFEEVLMEHDKDSKIRPPIPVRPEQQYTFTVEGAGAGHSDGTPGTPGSVTVTRHEEGGAWASGGPNEVAGAMFAPEDPEIRAMRICSAELEGLREGEDAYALSRVVGYLNRRFGG